MDLIAYVPIVVALLSLLSAIVVAVVTSRSDSLKRAERLADLAGKISRDSPVRAATEAGAQRLAIGWTFKVTAPAHRKLQAWFLVCLFVGLGLMVSSFLWAIRLGDLLWTLVLLVAGTAVYVTAFVLFRLRFRRRARWMKRARKDFGLPTWDGELSEGWSFAAPTTATDTDAAAGEVKEPQQRAD